MFLSLCYVVVRQVLQLAASRLRSNDFKELEIVVVRHQLAVLRRQTRRPQLTPTDRLLLAAASRCCRGRVGDRFWSRRRRSYVGTGASWPA